MTTTPNMGMSIPTPQVTLGPGYASQNNTAFEVIDGHDHTPGSGAQLHTASISIDADLSINGFNLTGLRTARLTDQTSITLSGIDIRAIYSKNGDLYYVNAAGAQVQLTAGSSIVGSTGNISGLVSPASASFSSLTGSFSFNKDTGKPGKLAISDISLYEFDNTTAQPVILKSPASLGSTYNFVFPTALPSVNSYMGVDSSGNSSFVASLFAEDGSVSNPSMTFASDTTTGLYRFGAGEFRAVAGGALSARFVSGQLITASGSLGTLGLAFDGNTTTGFYRSGTGTFSAVTSGAVSQTWTTTQSEFLDGSLAAPGLTFLNELGTGLYRSSTGIMSAAANGSLAARFSASQFVIGPSGSAASPGAVFDGNTNTGIYRPGSNQIGLSLNGVQNALFTSSLLTLAGGLTVTSNTQLGGTLSFDGGSTSIRMKVITGSIGTSTMATITAPATIKSICGTYILAGNDLRAIGDGSNIVVWATGIGGDFTKTRIQNNSSTLSATYSITVFY